MVSSLRFGAIVILQKNESRDAGRDHFRKQAETLAELAESTCLNPEKIEIVDLFTLTQLTHIEQTGEFALITDDDFDRRHSTQPGDQRRFIRDLQTAIHKAIGLKTA